MARSNGPFGPAGSRPPARRLPTDDPFAPSQQQPAPPPRYAERPHAPPPPPQGYHFPPEQDPNLGYNGQQPAPFDSYQPGAQHDQYGQPLHAPQDPYAQAQWGQHDPRAYDLGSYTPNGAQPHSNGAQHANGAPQFHNAPQHYPTGAPPYQDAPQGFPAGLAPYANSAPQPYANGHDPYASMVDPSFDQPGDHQDTYGQQGYAEPEGEYEDQAAEDEEPGRGRRWMFIVAALVGAVGVGGALAYTYKSFTAPSSGRVPLVKAEPNTKVRPETRDTRSLPSNDARLQGRLGEEDASRKAAAAITAEQQDDRASADESGGPRRVRTIPITPGGGQQNVQGSPPPVQASTGPQVVPGIMLDNMVRQPQAQPPPTPAGGPQRVVIGQPPPSVQAASRAQETPPPPARRVPSPPPQEVAVKAPPPPPPAARAAPPAAAPASTGAGYVAVLSSQKTRMDALKAFADLQQKYGDALSGRVPDVQEADLGTKGVWYRAVVGPPGSRDAANGVCSQLKTAGYGNCWVNPY